MREQAALEMEDVSIQFDGRPVLNGFSMCVAAGEKVALTGPSGVGKSTVLRCLLGLAAPAAGRIRICGEPLDGRSVWTLRRRMAYVPQEPQMGSGTAGEILRRPFEYRANAAHLANLDRLPELLGGFGLDRSILNQDSGALSGGEKQRLAWIGALLLGRPILLLDEASSALDEASRKAAADLLHAAAGVTVLSVSHDVQWRKLFSRSVTISPRAEQGDAP